MSKKLYLVETISMFRMRYVVECKEEGHALDTVTMHNAGGEELKEFSQQHLDEIISSSRELSKIEYLDLFDKDNDYLQNWSAQEKMNLVNTIDYKN